MDTTEIATAIARQTLESQIAPGTVRVASREEKIIAQCLWPLITDLDDLENQLAQHPEAGVLLECERPLEIIFQTVARSGSGNQCKILVTRPGS